MDRRYVSPKHPVPDIGDTYLRYMSPTSAGRAG